MKLFKIELDNVGYDDIEETISENLFNKEELLKIWEEWKK